MLIGLLDLAKVQTIVERAQHPVAVLSDVQGNIEIIAIPIPGEVQADIAARGLQTLAIAGTLDGTNEIEMPHPLPEGVAFAIGVAYGHYIEAQAANA